MKTVLLTLLSTGVGYFVGVIGGAILVSLLSNKHDKSVEAAMTGFFFTGPVLAVLSFIASLIYFLMKR